MKTIPVLILAVGTLFVGAVWLLVVAGVFPAIRTDQLEPLFTGLGFIGLVATFWHERSKTADAEQEPADVLAEMRLNTAMSTQANRIAILTRRIAALSSRIVEEPERSRTLGGVIDVQTERTKLCKELADLFAGAENSALR